MVHSNSKKENENLVDTGQISRKCTIPSSKEMG